MKYLVLSRSQVVRVWPLLFILYSMGIHSTMTTICYQFEQESFFTITAEILARSLVNFFVGSTQVSPLSTSLPNIIVYLIHYNRDKYTMLRSKYTMIRDTPSTYRIATWIHVLLQCCDKIYDQ